MAGEPSRVWESGHAMRRSGDRRLGFSLAFTSLRVWALSRRLDVTGAVPGSLSSRGGIDHVKTRSAAAAQPQLVAMQRGKTSSCILQQTC